MQTLSASRLSLGDLTEIWNLGYSGYFVPISLSPAQMERMILTGSLDLESSLVLLDGKAPVGFSMLGRRGDQGWIGGFGITPDYRGRGLAAELFGAHLLQVQALGLQRVRLEVMVQNWAQKVYARAGFESFRRLAVLAGAEAAETRQTLSVQRADPFALLDHSPRLHAACPAVWQREPESVRPQLSLDTFGLQTGPETEPTGYLLGRFQEGTVRILDAAADGVEEAAGLLGAAFRLHPGSRLFLINEPEGSPLHRAAAALGMDEVHAQHEMHVRRSGAHWQP